MIAPSRLSGTPWHTEFLKMDESDSRRHKSRCKYYIKENNICNYFHQKCYGSAHCKYYRESNNIILSSKIVERKKQNKSSIKNSFDKKMLCGVFKVRYLDENEEEKYGINDEIRKSPLFDEILNHKNGDIFELNGVKMQLIWKNVYTRKK